jgi:hypothetical protein
MKYVLAVLLLASGFAFAQEPGSKLYIPSPAADKTVDDGNKVVTTQGAAFNLVLQAEIFRQKLPFKMVSNSVQADYVVEWAAIPEEGVGRVSYTGKKATSKELYTVSASFVDKDKQVVWAGSADKKNLQDCAKNIAEQLQKEMKHKK